jgi:hypothetical protein
MFTGIALRLCDLPTELIERHGLDHRVHERGGERELCFLFRDRVPRLPVWRDGLLQIVRWGNGRGQSRLLRRTGWTWLATVNEGGSQGSEAVPVDIPASLGLGRGVWFCICRGIRGLLVPDEQGITVAYMICEPASHYYWIMTRCDRKPVLIDERI